MVRTTKEENRVYMAKYRAKARVVILQKLCKDEGVDYDVVLRILTKFKELARLAP